MASIRSNGNFKSYFFSYRLVCVIRSSIRINSASHRGRRLSCCASTSISNVFNFDAFTRVYPTWRVHVSPKRKKKRKMGNVTHPRPQSLYFLLRLVRWIKGFSLCILSIIPWRDWFRLRTSERRKERDVRKSKERERQREMRGEFYFVVVAEESACE